MAGLRSIEKKYFEDLFSMQTGYVLPDSLTNSAFSELFRDCINIDIYQNKYSFNGDSKAKRLRAFWEIEPDNVVAKVLDELLEVWKFEQNKKSKAVETSTYIQCKNIIDRLNGKKVEKELKEEDFLSKEFKNLDLSLLNIDIQLESVIKQRIDEIQKSLKSGASLAVIFLCGSVLEGLLQDKALKTPKEFNSANASPKKDGKVLPINEWSLNALIDVAYEVKIIELDIKKYSHVLKEFRNYIHPREQATSKFNPNERTAKISWAVLQAAIVNLSIQKKQ
ncbi:MAG: hypothetical protein PHE60_00895 [Sulfurospirillaceae bacterium]|nr:hypothetical protein [Sulfurospirillaceae bacterium]